MTSIILYGKPGIGKTSIANVICKEMNIPYDIFNASNDNKAKLTKIIDNALNHTDEKGNVDISLYKTAIAFARRKIQCHF